MSQIGREHLGVMRRRFGESQNAVGGGTGWRALEQNARRGSQRRQVWEPPRQVYKSRREKARNTKSGSAQSLLEELHPRGRGVGPVQALLPVHDEERIRARPRGWVGFRDALVAFVEQSLRETSVRGPLKMLHVGSFPST